MATLITDPELEERIRAQRAEWGGEIVSPQDRSREKFAFYAKVGVRELLLVDRDPWSLELYRLHDGQMELAGQSSLDRPDVFQSNILPLAFRLVPAETRPMIEARHTDGVQQWVV